MLIEPQHRCSPDGGSYVVRTCSGDAVTACVEKIIKPPEKWIDGRKEWHMKWKACGGQCNHRVQAKNFGEDEVAFAAHGEEVAYFVKGKIEKASGNTRGDESHFDFLRDRKIAKLLSGSSGQPAVVGAVVGPTEVATSSVAPLGEADAARAIACMEGAKKRDAAKEDVALHEFAGKV